MKQGTGIYRNDTLVFCGDSITFHCRDVIYPGHLGGGYVNFVAARLHVALASPSLKIHNTGISGDRISDIEARLDRDILSLSPTVISLLIGANDSLLWQTRNVPSPLPEFEAAYRRVLEKLRRGGVREFVIMEPFLLPVTDEQRRMRADFTARIDIIRQLAAEYAAAYVPLDGLFAEATLRAPATYWTTDGVHPVATTGDGLIADAWMQRVCPCNEDRPKRP